MTRLVYAAATLAWWLIDHHVQTANAHAVRRLAKEKP